MKTWLIIAPNGSQFEIPLGTVVIDNGVTKIYDERGINTIAVVPHTHLIVLKED